MSCRRAVLDRNVTPNDNSMENNRLIVFICMAILGTDRCGAQHPSTWMDNDLRQSSPPADEWC